MKTIEKSLLTKRIIACILIALGLFAFIFLFKNHHDIVGFMIVGILLGAMLQRSRFCFVSAVSNFVLMRDGRLLRGVLVGMMFSLIGYAIMMYCMVPDPSTGVIPVNAHAIPFGWHIAIGGILFGIGSTLSGGCVVGSLCRIGEGSLSVIILTLGILLGISIYRLQGEFWSTNFIADAKTIWLPAYLGWPGAVIVSIIGLLLLYYAIRIYEAKSLKNFIKSYRPHIDCKNFSIKSIVKPWPVTFGGLSIGLVNVISYLLVKRPIGVSAEYERWSELICNYFGITFPDVQLVSESGGILEGPSVITWCMVLNFSIILGSLIVSLLSGDFKIKYPKNLKAGTRILLGATVMGYGVGLAGGCNIGAFFSSVISFGLNGWVFGLTVFAGSLIGIWILNKTN